MLHPNDTQDACTTRSKNKLKDTSKAYSRQGYWMHTNNSVIWMAAKNMLLETVSHCRQS